ncbi:MAG: serine hydrolase domain-containing protein [Actinomycetota bacterium]
MRGSIQLEERLRSAVGDGVPGVALVVVGPEGIRARAAVGDADLSRALPMTTDTAMPWFSMTKIATATAAIRSADRGVLALDEPVLPMVPAMRLLKPADQASRITARHLLQHAGGLANPIPVSWVHPADTPGPDPDTFLQGLLAKHPKLRFEPGSRSSYSNLGTLILGAAMARASGSRFEDVARKEVLEPVGMTHTDFTFVEVVPAATGYHPARSPMRFLLPRWVRGETEGHWLGLRRFLLDGAAYGGLVGTAADAARFLRMHLGDGELDGVRVIPAESAVEMRRITLDGKRYDLGLGWFRPADARGADPPFVEHLGGGAGFFDVIRLYPTAGVGAAVMGNATKYDIDAVARLALAFA